MLYLSKCPPHSHELLQRFGMQAWVEYAVAEPGVAFVDRCRG